MGNIERADDLVGMTVTLLDKAGTPRGAIHVDAVNGDSVLGHFVSETLSEAMRLAFRTHEELANAQVLSLIDDVEKAIASFGFRLNMPEGGEQIEIDDLQVMNGTDVSFRPKRRSM